MPRSVRRMRQRASDARLVTVGSTGSRGGRCRGSSPFQHGQASAGNAASTDRGRRHAAPSAANGLRASSMKAKARSSSSHPVAEILRPTASTSSEYALAEEESRWVVRSPRARRHLLEGSRASPVGTSSHRLCMAEPGNHGLVAQLPILEDRVRDVDAEPRDAAFEPEAQDPLELAATSGFHQFRSGCCGAKLWR